MNVLQITEVHVGKPMSDDQAIAAVRSVASLVYACVCTCEIAEPGVADALGEEPQTAAELAERVGADSGALPVRSGSSRATAFSVKRGMADSATPPCLAHFATTTHKVSIDILKPIRSAAPTDAILLVIEAELPAGPEPHPAKGLDVMMLGWTTGRERTGADYEQLLSAADFKLERVIRASSEVSIFEALPVARQLNPRRARPRDG
jgi:hypothetical protein